MGAGEESDAGAPFYPRRAAWYTYGMVTKGSEAGSSPSAIEVRPTPNPNARKFVLAGIHFGPSRNYALNAAVDDPLAARLLALDGVYNVMLAQDFVTVNKVPEVAWLPLEAAVTELLTDYLSQHVTNHAD